LLFVVRDSKKIAIKKIAVKGPFIPHPPKKCKKIYEHKSSESRNRTRVSPEAATMRAEYTDHCTNSDFSVVVDGDFAN
jgi:hypothetical protein